MNVSLTPELERLVQDKVKSGLYLSASEVVREALRLLDERDQLRQIRLAELKKKIAVGVEQAERGEVALFDFTAIKAKARQRLAEARKGNA